MLIFVTQGEGADDMLKMAVYGGTARERQQLDFCVGEIGRSMRISVERHFYDNGDELLWDIDETGDFDMVAVYRDWDIARMMRERSSMMNIVMMADGACTELYDVQPCYLVYEPFDTGSIEKVMTAAIRIFGAADMFTFTSGRARRRVKTRDIMYFENDKRRINVVCRQHTYTYYGSMRELEQQMNRSHEDFIRVHESYMVNPAYVREFYADRLVMGDGSCIGISVGRRAGVREKCSAYMGVTHI